MTLYATEEKCIIFYFYHIIYWCKVNLIISYVLRPPLKNHQIKVVKHSGSLFLDIDIVTIIRTFYTYKFILTTHMTSISILPYHESLPVPQNMLPSLLGWDCFKDFPQFDGFMQKFYFYKGCSAYATLAFYVRLFNIHLNPFECRNSPVKSSRSPDVYNLHLL